MKYKKGQKKSAPEPSKKTANCEMRKNQEADVSSKRIFGNHTLCAQFLRDYSELPMFANVQPEDIEDVTERYHLFREVELQSDTVKKVHVRGQTDGETQDIYILSLIEHKSSVDYDVTMQILKYMVCIWENEAAQDQAEEENRAETEGHQEASGEKEGEKTFRRARRNKQKAFRYPPIYPIVYYEGSGEWTAAGSLKERILFGDLFTAYIPDFTYRLVRAQDYSNAELLSKEDAISLLMLLNKIQKAKDFEEIKGISPEQLNGIMQRVPVDAVEIIAAAVRSLCSRLNLTSEETTDFVKKVEGGNMGYLWENMEKMDIQLERRNTAEQRQRAEEAEKKAEEAEKKAQEAGKKAEEAEQEKSALYHILISTCQDQGMSRESVKQKLLTEAGLEEAEADKRLEMFWKN